MTAMVTVTTSAGDRQVAGTNFGTDQGILTVMDDTGATVAVFAPGVWQSAEVVPS